MPAAEAQIGTNDGAWRRLPPPSLEPSNDRAWFDESTSHIVSLGWYEQARALWRFDFRGSRRWASARLEQDPSLGGSRFVHDPVRRLVWQVGMDYVCDEASDTCYYEMQVWRLPLAGAPRWERVLPAGESPIARYGPALGIDEATNRLYLLGGDRIGERTVLGDLWELRLEPEPAWTRIHPAGGDLPGRVLGWAFVDQALRRLVVVGGSDTLGQDAGMRAHALELDGSRQWFELAASETMRVNANSFTVVTGRTEAFVLHEASRWVPGDSSYLAVLDYSAGGHWSRRSLGGSARVRIDYATALCHDPTTDRAILVGGAGRMSHPTVGLNYADVWSFPADVPDPDWSPHYESVDERNVSLSSAMALDPTRRMVHALNGYWRFTNIEGLYSFRLDDPTGWEYWPSVEPRPATRSGAVAIYDPVFDRFVLFGGGTDELEFGDLWTCRPATVPIRWKRHVGDGPVPVPRAFSTGVYDPVRRRMIVFGGYAGRELNDAWQLDLRDSVPVWTPLAVRGQVPPARWGHTAVYDAKRDGMVVFGGARGSIGGPTPLGDTWILSFQDCDAWLPLSPAGTPPQARYGHEAMYDPVADRMLLLWGRDANGIRFDTAALELGPLRWGAFVSQGIAPAGRDAASAFYDPLLDRALVLGGRRSSGYNEGDPLSDAWAVEWSRGIPPPPPPSAGDPGFILLGVGPNPSRGEVNIAFDLALDTEVQTRLYDVRGRLVRDMGAKRYTAGRHLLCWDGRTDSGGRMRDGVYFARIVVGGQAISGKIVLMD